MKGRFQFECKNDGLYFNVYEDAQKKEIELDDIVRYIDKVKVEFCDLPTIKSTLARAKTASVRVGNVVSTYNEFAEYKISPDGMKVEAVFYPAFVGSSDMTEDEVLKDLSNMGIRYGADRDNIAQIMRKREHFKVYLIAEGLRPSEGRDGFVTYCFDTDKKSKPKINDDGTVDFHKLDNLNHVKKGDVVATLTQKEDGTPGIDVFGKAVLPQKTKKAFFKYGRNLTVSEDGSKLITEVDGHVMLTQDKVFVSNVLELVNVDASTGDIEYEGNVVVTGNVLAGFAVKASGDIEIHGIVEGATIEAGNNLILARGVQGMGRADIKCKGNMVTKFLESASNVVVGGELETDSILHSRVEAKGKIEATGKNGLIVGGDVRSSVLISAKYIGNTMGTTTTVGVGVNPSDKRRIEILRKEIFDINDNKTKLNQIIVSLRKRQETEGSLEPDKLEMLQKTTRNLIMLENDMTIKKREYEELSAIVGEDMNARIKVSRTIYPGAKLVFGDIYMFIKNKYDYCQFLKEGADIKSIPL